MTGKSHARPLSRGLHPLLSASQEKAALADGVLAGGEAGKLTQMISAMYWRSVYYNLTVTECGIYTFSYSFLPFRATVQRFRFVWALFGHQIRLQPGPNTEPSHVLSA